MSARLEANHVRTPADPEWSSLGVIARASPPDELAPSPPPADERHSDEELIRRGRPGVDALFRRHHLALYRFCLSLLRRPDEAADASQAAWVRALVALSGEGTDVLNVRPWLYAIARNECLDRLRAGSAAPVVNMADVDLPSATTPEDAYEQRVELRTLLADLDTLSERQRSAIVLREVAGLGPEELAEALATSAERALGLVADARRALLERRRGRALPCDVARRELGRVRRCSGGLRAHLEHCGPCQTFERQRRGRALSSLALTPWLAVRGIADWMTAWGGQLDGRALTLVATAVAAGGSVGAAVPSPDREAAPLAVRERPATPAQRPATGRPDGASPARAAAGDAAAVGRARDPGRVSVGPPGPEADRQAESTPPARGIPGERVVSGTVPVASAPRLARPVGATLVPQAVSSVGRTRQAVSSIRRAVRAGSAGAAVSAARAPGPGTAEGAARSVARPPVGRPGAVVAEVDALAGGPPAMPADPH